MKTSLVIGASTKVERYSYQAMVLLQENGHHVIGIGRTEAKILNAEIKTGLPELKNIDTVTMYLSPERQTAFYDYVISMKPRRIIFNPGAENAEFAKLAKDNGITTENACTLVLLRTDQY